MEKYIEINLLKDFYGKLLPRRQQQVIELYIEENLSLSEIADEFGISRQAAHDAFKTGTETLYKLEKELGLVGKFKKRDRAVRDIDERIGRLMTEYVTDGRTNEELKKIKHIIDDIND